ncbi:CopG family transcriptional regulator [Sphingomonas sp. 1P08PE]|uniref:CopG family transcriptional regulator n=1 Tax=Sphingomonas sp. 1P08PE TaxID=554122 RepID=UPI00399FDBED
MKVRQNLYIDQAVSDALEALAVGSRFNKSRLVNDALVDWLNRRGSGRVESVFKDRLDRIAREQELIRRDIEVLLESLSLFVRYQLTVSAPLPDADSAARAVGRERFEAFVSQVGRQLGSGTRTIAPPGQQEKPA